MRIWPESTLTHLESKVGERRCLGKGMEEGKDVGLSIGSVPLGFCPRECRIGGARAGDQSCNLTAPIGSLGPGH